MDTKKLILAIVLSVTVLLVYQYLFMPKPAAPERLSQPAAAQPQRTAETTESKGGAAPDIASIMDQSAPEAAVVQPGQPLLAVSESLAAAAEQAVCVENEYFSAVFTNRGAGLTSFVLKKYKDDAGKPMDLVAGGAKESNFYPFYFYSGKDDFSAILNKALFLYRGTPRVIVAGPTQVVFEYADADRNLKAIKRFTFRPGSYGIGLEFAVWKDGRLLADLPVAFGPNLGNNEGQDRAMMMSLKIAAYANEKLESVDFARLKTAPQAGQAFETAYGEKGAGFYWAAYETTYFAAVFRSQPQNRSKLSYRLIKQPQAKNQSKLYSYMIVTDPTAVFLGPKDEKVLAAMEAEFPDLNKVIEYGWFGSIAKIMLKGITYIHGFIPNYGWALIVFTLLLKLVLFP
ncbi:MAG: membrane protein insertase YidC, partial [Candidatus Aminicenantes bacterium]|nr:membrane protein insertase YidC [Candidatus Aminicenantes bacterium]